MVVVKIGKIINKQKVVRCTQNVMLKSFREQRSRWRRYKFCMSFYDLKTETIFCGLKQLAIMHLYKIVKYGKSKTNNN